MPLLAEVIEIQSVLLTTVQLQLAGAVTLIVPLPPALGKDALTEESDPQVALDLYVRTIRVTCPARSRICTVAVTLPAARLIGTGRLIVAVPPSFIVKPAARFVPGGVIPTV